MGQSKMLIINIAPKQEHNAIIKAIKYPEYPKYSHGEWANLIIIITKNSWKWFCIFKQKLTNVSIIGRFWKCTYVVNYMTTFRIENFSAG